MKTNSLKKIGTWVISILLGASFILAGWPKIMPNESMLNRFESWGYSANFTVLIGLLELAAGILVLIPRAAFYGAIVIVVLMLGAVYTHVSTQIGSPLFAIIYFGMAVGLIFQRAPKLKTQE